MVDNQNLVIVVYSCEYTMTSMRCQLTKVIHVSSVSHVAKGKQPSTGESCACRRGGEARETSFTSPLGVYPLHAHVLRMHIHMHAVYMLPLCFMDITLMVSARAI